MKVFLLINFICFSIISFSQSVAINSTGLQADASAMLDVSSQNKGVLVPRMSTSQRTAIVNPAKGLLVFDSITISLWFYSGSNWLELRGVGSPNFWQPHANGIYYNAGKVGIGITPDPTIPLTVFLPNTGVGNSSLDLKSNDTWHSSLRIFNGDPTSPSQKFYGLILAGPANTTALPGTFGIFNHNMLTWGLNFHPTTNFMAVGSTTVNSNTPKSRLHVFAGDVNVDQIGSGIILKSPNGNCWRVTVDDAGNLVRTAITCP
jgi:hypothetical protein